MQEKIVMCVLLFACVTAMILLASSISAERIRAKMQKMHGHDIIVFKHMARAREELIIKMQIKTQQDARTIRNISKRNIRLQHKVGVLQARNLRLQKRGK